MFPKITGIMAATREGIVGDKGGLPWHYPDETEFFREITKNHIIVMGLKTYQAAPKKMFETRSPIVFTHHDVIPNAATVHGREDFLAHLNKMPADKTVYMIGGAELAHYFIKENLLSEFLLTTIYKNHPGDTRLDVSLLQDWPYEVFAKTADYTINRLMNPHFKEL